MIQASLFKVPSVKTSKPFLKWAGGKTQLLTQIRKHLPEPLQDDETKWPHHYFEPFMGSAALFFHLAPNLRLDKTMISDTNQELVLTFTAVRDHVDRLIEKLRVYDELHNHQFSGDETAQRSHYKAIRALDRQEDWGNKAFTNPVVMVEHAARFIYLNKTCFNGLWRVNSKGYYNVPMGRYKNPGICNEELLRTAHASLQNVSVKHQSFEDAVVSARENDFVYFDPPYVPVSQTSSFNAYAKDAFLEQQHRKLAIIFLILASRRVHVVLSNADTSFTREPLGSQENFANFAAVVSPAMSRLKGFGTACTEELFESYRKFWNVETVTAKRTINSKAEKRGAITEILVSSR